MSKSDPNYKNLGMIIRPMRGMEEARVCARVMAESEPWITLRRGFDHALAGLINPSLEVYVACAGDAVAGHIAVNMHGAFTGYIQVLAVAAEWRSRGVGAQLMQFAEQRIFRESPNVFLCVSAFNPRAQKFYARLDYERIGELKDYVVAGQSEIFMRKTLGPRNGYQPRT